MAAAPKTPLKFEVFLVLGILEFPTMSSPSPFGGFLYGILDLGILVLGILEFLVYKRKKPLGILDYL